MSRYSWKAMLPFTFLLMLLVAACGNSSTTQTSVQSTPTPALAQGQALLTQAGQNLKTAKTLHAIYDITTTGSAASGIVNTEVWNASPDRSRTVVLQSSLKQFSTGSITVSNGKQVWQYDPAKKVVYTAKVGNNTSTSTGGAGQSQTQFIMNIVQTVFFHSNATLVSSTAIANGHAAYDIQVTSAASAPKGSTGQGSGTFNYNGDVYLDKASKLPLQVKLTIQGFGQVTLNLPMLVLDQPVDNSLFIFVPPADVQVLPFPKTTTSSTGTITLVQAQQQAGYHLLSVPSSQTAYQLQGVDALGAPSNQIFTLNYAKGNTTFAISEGKSLANLPVSGQQVKVHGTTATLSSSDSTLTLTWSEKGVGIQIAGDVSKDELLTIANILV
jgi:outer membrane lipoprotein-sorting protein